MALAAQQRFRGARRFLPKVVIYTFGGALDVSAYLVSVTTDKQLGAPTGTWSVTLKSHGVIAPEGALPVRNWHDLVTDDDWVTVEFDAGVDGDLVMLGLVDSVELALSAGQGGAAVRAWTIRGRDFAKVFADTEAVTLPVGPGHGLGDLLSFHTAIDALRGDVNPGRAVRTLLDFFLRRGQNRGRTPFWAIPPSLPGTLVDSVGAGPQDRQFGDILETGWLDETLDGSLPATELFNGVPNEPVKLLEVLSGFANDRLNECFFDLRSAPPQVVTGGGGGGLVVRGWRRPRPCLVLRERPFPVLPSTAAEHPAGRSPSDAWAMLATHELAVTDLEGAPGLTRAGRERINWWMVTVGAGFGVNRYALALAEAAQGLGLDLTTAPAIDVESVRRHGWRRMEVQSRYIDPSVDALLVARRWTHLLRDWYWANHLFLAGTLQSAHIHPEIRVGHRLRLLDRDGSWILFYVEGVRHQWRRMPDGRSHGTTAFTVTRGTRDTDRALPPLGGTS